jgi:hypothetical protein
MADVTLSLPDEFAAALARRASSAGFCSIEEYVVTLIQADCHLAETEQLLRSRIDGPFEPLEDDWMERVRRTARIRE